MNINRVMEGATKLGYTCQSDGNYVWIGKHNERWHRLAWVTIRDSGGKGVLKFTSHNTPDELQQLLEETA